MPGQAAPVIALLNRCAARLPPVPRFTTAMFAARSRPGRSIKVFLFGLGAILPLGSLIWALLAWHGTGVARTREPR